MKKLTYNHGTGNVGLGNKLVATIQHVQMEGQSQSYFNVQFNNYRDGMSPAEHLAVFYNGAVGFKDFDTAWGFVQSKF